MTSPEEPDLPDVIVYTLEEAVSLLVALDEASITLTRMGFLAGAVQLADEIQTLARKLNLDGFEGEPDDD